MNEREWQRIEKLRTAKWLIAEARWRGHEIHADGRSALGKPEVAWTMTSGLLHTLELHWRDLPDQVQGALLRACAAITNHDRRPRSKGVSL